MSAKPILYYLPGSPPVRSVLLVAKAIELELDLKLIDFAAGEHLQPWFVALNPQHTVPTLVDDGRVLWDSHAISTYLILKYGGRYDHQLYPRDLYTRARIDQRLQFDTGVMFAATSDIVRSILYKGAVGPTKEQVVAVQAAYALLETFLATDKYLVGNELTVADLALISSVTTAHTQVPLQAAKYPRVAAWVKRLAELPYFHDTDTVNLAGFVSFLDGAIRRSQAARK